MFKSFFAGSWEGRPEMPSLKTQNLQIRLVLGKQTSRQNITPEVFCPSFRKSRYKSIMCGTSNLKSFNVTNTNKDTLPPPWLLSTMSSFFFSLESGSTPGRLKLEPKTLEPSFT